jgi:hypothetical protein
MGFMGMIAYSGEAEHRFRSKADSAHFHVDRAYF